MSLTGNTYLGVGSEADVQALLTYLAANGEMSNGPDFWLRTYSHMGIDEARELRERAFLKPVASARRVFAVIASHLTVEAQNGLLKILEEPPAHALFILLVPAPQTLLPTLRSRALLLPPLSSIVESLVDPVLFLQAAEAKRLEMLKPLLEKGDDDKRDLGAILAFLAALERELEAKVSDPAWHQGIRALYQSRAYITDKGALIKPLLEQLALILPAK